MPLSLSTLELRPYRWSTVRPMSFRMIVVIAFHGLAAPCLTLSIANLGHDFAPLLQALIPTRPATRSSDARLDLTNLKDASSPRDVVSSLEEQGVALLSFDPSRKKMRSSKMLEGMRAARAAARGGAVGGWQGDVRRRAEQVDAQSRRGRS